MGQGAQEAADGGDEGVVRSPGEACAPVAIGPVGERRTTGGRPGVQSPWDHDDAAAPLLSAYSLRRVSASSGSPCCSLNAE